MTTLRQAHGDSFFNHRVAKQAHDMVMAMDPDDAVQFALHVSYGLLQDDIANNRRTIDRHVQDVSKQVLNAAASAVRRGRIDMSVYDEVAKSLEPVIKNDWDENSVKRDKGGQFSRTEQRGGSSRSETRVRTNNAHRPMTKKEERKRGIPSAKELSGERAGVSGSHKLSPQERSAYQQQYLQIVDTLDRYASAGVDSEDVRMVVRDKRNGAERTRPVIVNGVVAGNWNPSLETVEAIGTRADRPGMSGGQRAQMAGFDTVNAISRTGPQASTFADKWNDPSRDTPGTNERTYRRVQAGADLVTQLNTDPVTGAPLNNKVAAAAGLASLAGQYGPQAEQVLGPQARKTAYRYRGTERKPDAALTKLVGQAQRQEIPAEHLLSAQQKAQIRMGQNPLPSEVAQNAAALASQSYLLGRVPDPKLSEIHRKAGKIPPSEGVIISSDGSVSHQSVGFADDHYLPFNLKNLKDLKGGQYVRTRTSGGLTTEDIYTGLVSGARSVTVVSNSGVFTVDFADDLRGGRRMSDKAASMVGQYGKTLDALKEGRIEREPLSAEVRAQILSDVQSEYEGMPVSREEVQNEYTRRVKEYRELPVLTERELKAIDVQVADAYPEGGRKAQTAKLELQEAALETRQDRYYKLDGEGYAAAARALKEQYPYFIGSVSYQTRQSRQGYNGERGGPSELASRLNNRADSGYVKPRHNRPQEAQAGYYDETITGRGKMDASETNYQNWEHNPQRKARAQAAAAPAPKEAEATEEGQDKAKTAPKSNRDVRRMIQEQDFIRAEQKEAVATIAQVAAEYRGDTSMAKDYPKLAEALDKGDLEEQMANPNSTKLVSELNAFAARAGGDDKAKIEEALARYRGAGAGSAWEASQLGKSPKQPYRFEGQAYSANATPDQVAAEIRTHEKRAMTTADADDSSLQKIAESAGRLSVALKSGDQTSIINSATALARAQGADEEQVVTRANGAIRGDHARLSETYAGVAESAERLRALKGNRQFVGAVTPKPQAQAPSGNDDAMYQHIISTAKGGQRGKAAVSSFVEAANDTPNKSEKAMFQQVAWNIGQGDLDTAESILRREKVWDDPDYRDLTNRIRGLRGDDD